MEKKDITQEKEVEFSQKTVVVRKLRIFELDQIPLPNTKPFTYKIRFGENVVEEVYQLQFWQTPPKKPEGNYEEVLENSPEWFKWRDYHLYHAAVAYRMEQKRALARYKDEVKAYIFEHCLDEKDYDAIVTDEDWVLLCQAALIPEVTLQDLEEVGLNSFNATYGGQSLLSLFLELSNDDTSMKSTGDVYIDYLKEWEINTMMEVGLTEEEWQELSIKERARKIFAKHLPAWRRYIDYRLEEGAEKVTV